MAAPIVFQWNTLYDYPSRSILTSWKRKCKCSKVSSKAELLKMLHEARMYLEPIFETYLAGESYTLTRLLYKNRNQQKHWKLFNLLDKIKKCMQRARSLNLCRYFKDVLSLCDIKKDMSDMQIVPADMFMKFIVERTVGLAKLCSCILQLCEDAFHLIVGQLVIGDFLAQNVILVASVSRIWVLIRSVLVKMFPWYKLLMQFCIENYEYNKIFQELPTCLASWVGFKVNSLKTKKKKTQQRGILDKMFGVLSAENYSEPEMPKDILYSVLETCSKLDPEEVNLNLDNGVAIPRKKRKKAKKKTQSAVDVDKDTDGCMEIEKKAVFTPTLLENEDISSHMDLMGNKDNGVVIPRKKRKKKKRKETTLMNIEENVDITDICMKTEDEIAFSPVLLEDENIPSHNKGTTRKKRKRKERTLLNLEENVNIVGDNYLVEDISHRKAKPTVQESQSNDRMTTTELNVDDGRLTAIDGEKKMKKKKRKQKIHDSLESVPVNTTDTCSEENTRNKSRFSEEKIERMNVSKDELERSDNTMINEGRKKKQKTVNYSSRKQEIIISETESVDDNVINMDSTKKKKNWKNVDVHLVIGDNKHGSNRALKRKNKTPLNVDEVRENDNALTIKKRKLFSTQQAKENDCDDLDGIFSRLL